jgi:hypothetical protein
VLEIARKCAASDAVAVREKSKKQKKFPHKLDVIEVEWVAIKCVDTENNGWNGKRAFLLNIVCVPIEQ